MNKTDEKKIADLKTKIKEKEAVATKLRKDMHKMDSHLKFALHEMYDVKQREEDYLLDGSRGLFHGANVLSAIIGSYEDKKSSPDSVFYRYALPIPQQLYESAQACLTAERQLHDKCGDLAGLPARCGISRLADVPVEALDEKRRALDDAYVRLKDDFLLIAKSARSVYADYMSFLESCVEVASPDALMAALKMEHGYVDQCLAEKELYEVTGSSPRPGVAQYHAESIDLLQRCLAKKGVAYQIDK